MNLQLAPRKRLIDLFVLLLADFVFYFLWQSAEFVVLFNLGFIWNWVAAQDLKDIFSNRRYRFSMLKTVVNIQQMATASLDGLPKAVHILARSLPAGIFWFMVTLFNESVMPWWATFLGSFAFELLQLDIRIRGELK